MARILLIDDESSVLDFLQARMEHLGHTTVRAENCEQALTAIDDSNIDMIIADIYLPDSPGPTEWIEQLKAKAGTRPLVIITGFPEQMLIDLCKKLEISLLSKPFELVFLDDIVSKATGDA